MLPYIKLFSDTSTTVDLLTDEEAGRLFKAVLRYANGQEVELPGRETLVFSMLKTQIDRDATAYEEFREKQRVNGLKGGRPKKPVVNDDNPENPEVYTDNPVVDEENPKNPVVILQNPKSQEKDKDKDKEEDKEKESKRRFTPPSPEEVSEYCKEHGYSIDPEAFIAFYESKGWKVGNQPMKSWKAAIVTWTKRSGVKKVAPQKEDDDGWPDLSQMVW